MYKGILKNRQRLGSFLIFLAVFILVFTYYPIFKLYFEPPSASFAAIESGFYLYIPKIGAKAPIIQDVDPWKENEYLPALQKGVAQAQGSALPGTSGPIYLFAHSSDVPWRMTRINTAFLRLGELNKGDAISIFNEGKEYKYTVADKKEVWPKEVQYLKNLTGNQLILQTCTPIGTAFKRLLIFANPG